MRTLGVIIVVVTALTACEKEPVVQAPDRGDGRGPAHGLDGSDCVADKDCDGGLCLPEPGWRDGYCTTPDCPSSACNNDQGHCVQFLDDTSYCLDGCDSNLDCRVGYRCRAIDASGVKVCYRDEADGPSAGRVGAACDSDDDCDDAAVCDTSLPGGYCVVEGCSGTCDLGAVCVPYDDGPRCLDACNETRDCRVGYICVDDAGPAHCVPTSAVETPVSFEETVEALGIECNAREVEEVDGIVTWHLDFDIPEGTTSYIVTPLVRVGAVRPVTLITPEATIDLVDDYRHQNLRVTEFESFAQESEGTQGAVAMDWPITVPYAPKHQEMVVPGAHTLEVKTTVDPPCLYVMTSEDGDGATLDLNVYLVGLEDLTSASAPTDTDLGAVFQRVDELLAAASFRIGTIEFYDVPREIGERYAYVRELGEIQRATAFGRPRDATRAGHLNVDIFLVADILINGAAILGLSAGLPGAPGMHGNAANGLIFTTADLGNDNDFVAHIMAHELGHYLGLRHTTEIVFGTDTEEEELIEALLGTTDPIDDTPVCEGLLYNPTHCPDYENLMFPSAPMHRIEPVVTPGQASVLRANPLVRVLETP